MTDSYYLDLTQFSLGRLREMLETGEVLPSRRILCDHLAENFARLESLGINNVQQVVDALSSKKKVEAFAQKSGLTVEYLTILGRQARSYTPTPAEFKDIPGLDPAHVERLAALGIKNTRQLFERATSRADRTVLAQQSGIPAESLLELVQLSDIVRAGFVGPIYARLLYAAGVQSLDSLAQQQPDVLFEQMRAVNEIHHYTKAWFTIKDVV
ncbi:MAG: DUF4332 domain-containing protein, partial [Chloroflexi bacterium]|nr:DUF4332 domain-containing protein [Chloroflexota bacterium]